MNHKFQWKKRKADEVTQSITKILKQKREHLFCTTNSWWWFSVSVPPKIADDDWVGSNSSLETSKSEMISSNSRRITEDGLIMPKKLINPCLESSDRQSLHRELLFNQKMWVVDLFKEKTKLLFGIE